MRRRRTRPFSNRGSWVKLGVKRWSLPGSWFSPGSVARPMMGVRGVTPRGGKRSDRAYAQSRDYREFRAEVGHDRSKGARQCRDAKNLAFPTPFSTSCWPVPIPRRFSIPSSWKCRDRQARFDPQLIAKYQRRFPGFDDKIISMYARGMSTREIVGHLRELYGIDVSPDLISAVTDAVLEEVSAWQARPLAAIYPLVFFDALRVKIRDEGLVRNKAIHIALGVRADGTKEILGLWLEQNEGA